MTEQVTAADAIHAALQSDWRDAIRINTLLLKKDKYDLDALCRLGFAYMKTGQLLLAKNTYQKVLKHDQYNLIALKNIQRLGTLKKKNIEQTNGSISPLSFIEEPGKTKLVDCIHLAPMTVLSTLSAGLEVQLKPRKHCVEIRTMNGTYIAALPDDLSFKLNKLMTGGNTYQAIIKSADKKVVRVMIRETKRGKRFTHQPTFIGSGAGYTPFTRTVTPIHTDPYAKDGQDEEGEELSEE